MSNLKFMFSKPGVTSFADVAIATVKWNEANNPAGS